MGHSVAPLHTKDSLLCSLFLLISMLHLLSRSLLKLHLHVIACRDVFVYGFSNCPAVTLHAFL